MLLIVGYHYFSVETIAHCYKMSGHWIACRKKKMKKKNFPSNHHYSLCNKEFDF